jgi:LacI family transcriptional regulator
MEEKITIKTIADLVGVSVGTVDRALNERGRINEETKQRILDVCKQLNYKPNNIARALGRQKRIKIAAILPEKPKYFFDKMKKGIQTAQQELSDYGIKIEYLFTESLDPVKQEEVIKEIRLEKFDGIMINAGSSLLNKYINAFVGVGVPVVTFNSDINESKRLFYVGHNDILSGGIAAELMGGFLCGNGNVVILTGFKNVHAHINRVDGFSKVIDADYPNIHIIDQIEYQDNEEKVFAIAKGILKNHQDIHGIFVTSAPGAVGVGRAILSLKPERIPKLVGYDVNEHVRDLFKKGICSAVIYQDPFAQSYYALKFLARHILDGWYPKKTQIYIRSRIVLKQNIDEYVNYQEKEQDALYDI